MSARISLRELREREAPLYSEEIRLEPEERDALVETVAAASAYTNLHPIFESDNEAHRFALALARFDFSEPA